MSAHDFRAPGFLDTNIFVYAYDPADRKKQRVAQDLVRSAQAGDFVTSVQVLAEFAATLLHKISTAARPRDVAAVLDALVPIHVVTPDAHMVRRAVDARSEYGIHFYDGMIVAAAERAGCSRILSEDLNSGQSYFGVTVQNPFQ
jgi:predicted nucleic acid-binding protein